MEFISAFFAGLLSFFSPCIFPILPGYLSLISGISFSELNRAEGLDSAHIRAGLSSIFFTAGFSLAFALMGASASGLGRLAGDYRGAISSAAGAIMILLGAHMAGLLNIGVLNYEKRFSSAKLHSGFAGAFFMGFAFALGWTPCIGPILAGLLAMAALQESARQGMLLLFTFSLGLGIPFVAAGFAVGKLAGFFAKHRNFMRYSEKIAGALFIAMGAILLLRDKLPFLRSVFPV